MIYEYFSNNFNPFNQSANIRILFDNKKLMKKKVEARHGAPLHCVLSNSQWPIAKDYLTTIFYLEALFCLKTKVLVSALLE